MADQPGAGGPRAEDRRHHELYVSEDGRRVLGSVREVASLHEDDLFAALGEEDGTRLTELLGRIAEQQGLAPGVHPGYRRLPKCPG
ncbi:hypothetical protein [Streptomyces sp. NK15101]|uniref:hypothetical protein n=1 Tax=Streptomyces sp. NK15101 TaxID=2873261 RepID=UPI001CEDD10E|nr:hypothetical protein [Streptomyces sp. NK15101]